jgi:hypothetical protein
VYKALEECIKGFFGQIFGRASYSSLVFLRSLKKGQVLFGAQQNLPLRYFYTTKRATKPFKSMASRLNSEELALV